MTFDQWLDAPVQAGGRRCRRDYFGDNQLTAARDAWEAATAAERDACAVACVAQIYDPDIAFPAYKNAVHNCAAAIRSRGAT